MKTQKSTLSDHISLLANALAMGESFEKIFFLKGSVVDGIEELKSIDELQRLIPKIEMLFIGSEKEELKKLVKNNIHFLDSKQK
jgi:hypothetical protein